MYHDLFEGFSHCKLVSFPVHSYMALLQGLVEIATGVGVKKCLHAQKLRVLISALTSFELFNVLPCSSSLDNCLSLEFSFCDLAHF